MKTSRPWYMRKIVLPVLCVLGVAIPNLLNYCDWMAFQITAGISASAALTVCFTPSE